jgi:glycosyltransferase involved in cell wall biosynthesis
MGEAAAAAPLVTVLMTAFNREQYIGAAIDSVLAQTFREFELLIVDDASTDETVRIAREYERADSRVRVVVNERNLGDYPNRNRAASLVRTPLFKFHDSDDIMYPHCLQVMVGAMTAEPRADFALTASRPWSGGAAPMLLTPAMCYAREYLGQGMFHVGPACALFRRSWFEQTGGFALHGTISDYYFWMRACRTAHVVLVAADLFWYRTHSGQELRTEAAMRGIFEIERAAWEALFDAACPLRAEILEQARRNRLNGLLRRAVRDLIAGNGRAAVARLGAADVPLRHWVRYLRGRRVDVAAGTPQWRAS